MTIVVRISAIAILLCTLLIVSYPVWAQESTSTGTTRKNRVQERVETKRENVKERVETRKDAVAERMEDRKAAIATREAALKTKLAAFRDKKKAEVVDRVNTNLNRINKNHTNHMLRFLDNASKILAKLEERVNKATSDIKDTSSAKVAIIDAKAAIEEAKGAVEAQADKDYTVTVSSEGKARIDVKTIRDRLHGDLKAVRDQVVVAKQAVANAIRIAKSGPSTSSGSREATRSGQ